MLFVIDFIGSSLINWVISPPSLRFRVRNRPFGNGRNIAIGLEVEHACLFTKIRRN